MAKKYTLSFAAANGYALGLVIPITAGFLFPYAGIYSWPTLGVDLLIFFTDIPLLLASVVIGTIVHEFIHAACWAWLDNISWDKIHFGFKWKTLTPYVHCPEPIEVGSYRWGVAMPVIVLGIVPYVGALLFQSGWLLGFSLFFTIAASGDILILWLLRRVLRGQYVQDHPELIGCRVVDSTEKDTLTPDL